MKLKVNPATCDGFGFCAEIVPDIITLDEWGFPIVSDREIPKSSAKAVRLAVRCCPRRALSLDDPTPSQRALSSRSA